VQVLWSRSLPAPVRGLALAREPGAVLVWDARRLFLLDRAGEVRSEWTFPGELSAAASADDGSCHAAVGAGQVICLDTRLRPRWQRGVPHPAVGVALDPGGVALAVADSGGALHLFDPQGRRLWKASSPRPLRFLALAAEEPLLAGSADYGLVALFDRAGSCLWRDGLVAHVGSLAVTGDGSLLALACFSEGVVGYSFQVTRAGAVAQRGRRVLAQAAPCRLAALSFSGELLTAGLEGRLCVRDRDGGARGEWDPGGTPVGLGFGALGDYAVVALAEGRVVCVDTREAGSRAEGR
jgi:hypothetical protein